MEKPAGSRRRFLWTVAALAASCLAVWRYLTPRMTRRSGSISVPKADIPSHTALVYRDSQLAILREHDEIYGLRLVCTHLGCTVSVTPRALICPCHGSTFDRSGKVLEGPAGRPLERCRVEDRGEFIVVST